MPKTVQHHWPYAIKHKKDTIKISASLHKFIHYRMSYDFDGMFYRTKGMMPYFVDNYPLDTREKHQLFISMVRENIVRDKLKLCKYFEEKENERINRTK